ESSGFIKKILKIPGLNLVLPLLGGTIIIVLIEPFVAWILFNMKNGLENFLSFFIARLPLGWASRYVANILLLTLLSLFPTLVLETYIKRRSYFPFRYGYVLSTVIWLVIAILLVLGFNGIY